MLYDEQVWPLVHDSHLWVFDKLILSRRLGHLCGPACVPVPTPGYYVVRPCVNLAGMGAGTSKQWIERETDHLPAGYFWQEVFTGRHLSLDYQDGKLLRCTEGFRDDGELIKFNRWAIVSDAPEIPPVVEELVNQQHRVNIEMIGGKVIEVHLRGNPDFDGGATEIIPVWRGQDIPRLPGYRYEERPDGDRLGVLIR